MWLGLRYNTGIFELWLPPGSSQWSVIGYLIAYH